MIKILSIRAAYHPHALFVDLTRRMDRREDGRLVERAAVMRVITSAVFQRMNREVYNKVYRFFVRVIPCDSNRDNVCLSLESLKLVRY